MSSSSPSQTSPQEPLQHNGRRSERVTTQASTAASHVRATTRYTSSPPSSASARRTGRLRTEPRASDPQSQDDFPQCGADMTHTDEEGLRFAGYRGNQFFERLDRDCAGRRMQICVCKSVIRGKDGQADDVEVEGLVRCAVRDCDPGWFHLGCVGLPDHPPMRLGWMCPACILAQGIPSSMQGLWDVKRSEDLSGVKDWLTEVRSELGEAQVEVSGSQLEGGGGEGKCG